MLSNRVNRTLNALRSRDEPFCSMIVLTPFLAAAKPENIFLFSPGTNTRHFDRSQGIICTAFYD